MVVVSTTPPSPIAALTVGAVHATLHEKKPVEAVVKQTLRSGSRDGTISNAEQRAAVASAVFGTSVLRARLAKLLAATGLPPASQGPEYIGSENTAAASRRLAASRALLALFLLHETPQRLANPQVMQQVLPATSLGLAPSTLDRYSRLDVSRDVVWPESPVMRIACEHSLPVGLARLWLRCADGDREEAAELAAAFNTPGPVMLRANVAASLGGCRSISKARDDLIDALSAELPSAVKDGSLSCQRGCLSPWAVALEGSSRTAWGGSVWNLESWRRGMFEVQDEGSQCIALACEVVDGERVLDLCAGNGGKTLALAALVGESGRVLAHDVVESRLAALRASAARARIHPGVVHTVATEQGACAQEVAHGAGGALEQAAESLAPAGFDLVLVDAPCTSSGTLRRHPGLRWSGEWAGSHASWEEYPALQLQLLLQAATLMRRPGGRLVYATCSLDPRENEQVVDAFESAMQAAGERLEAWPFEDGVAGRHETSTSVTNRRTLWPHRHGTDGFFVCRWRFSI